MINKALSPRTYVYMMAKRFNTILVPVDFSVNTEVAISKALELSQDQSCELHLFYVQPIELPNIMHYVQYLVTGYSRHQLNASVDESNKKLEYLKSVVELRNHHVAVSTWVSFGEPVEKAILAKAKRLAADLIVIGKRSHHSRFPFLNTVVPSRIAAASGIPVLTAKPGSLNKEIKTVVIPVDSNYPAAKLKIWEALRNEAMSIRLVIFPEDSRDPVSAKQSLLDTFRMLRIQSSNPVNYEVLSGRNKAKALLSYCSKIDADVLIAYPGRETRVGVWANSHISDVLPADSRMQVLSVRPN